MKVTLLIWFVPVTLATIGLIVLRYRLSRRQTAAELSAIASQNETSPKYAGGVA